MALAATLTITMVGSVFAQAPGITPVRCVGVALDGANRSNTTPATTANGGPVGGLIPRDMGQAPLIVGDRCFDAPGCPAT